MELDHFLTQLVSELETYERMKNQQNKKSESKGNIVVHNNITIQGNADKSDMQAAIHATMPLYNRFGVSNVR